MPTSYTSSLGLALPVTGELPGSWGDTVNDYITRYLDAAVAGVQTISGSQTAVTLSVTTGTTLSQAGAGATGSSQYMVINCTGNPAGLLTITAPAVNKTYLILNNTSTAQSVKIVGTGPTTGVTVTAAQNALVAWNGSDFELVATVGALLSANNAFTGANTFYNSTGQTFGTATSTQDGVIIAGRAGGSSSYRVTLAPGTLSNNRSQTLPDAAGAVVIDAAAQTLTNKTFTGYTETVFTLGTSGSIALNPANGTMQTCAAAGTVTFTDSLAAGQSLLLMLTGGSTYTINWPTVTWVTGVGNVAPTRTNSDTYAFWKIGTTLYATYVGSYA